MTFGTFDIYHKGHESYLRQARLHCYASPHRYAKRCWRAKHCGQAKNNGVYLIVVVARDKNVLEIKGKAPKNDEKKRKEVLENSKLTDEVVLGNLEDKFEVIRDNKPEIIALGYDQKVDLEELKANLKKYELDAKIIRLEAYKPEIYKSSKLLDNIK